LPAPPLPLSFPPISIPTAPEVPSVNDTVVGDPLLAVPLSITAMAGLNLNLGGRIPSLCFEIHGEESQYFNLVSDDCVSVNAHYVRLNEYLNIIDQVAVRAVDDTERCRNIAVDLDTCLPTLDGVQLRSNFKENGVFIRIYRSHVRISVPNCNGTSHLVMNVICQRNLTLIDPFTYEKSKADMIKYVITRGINLNENSHGLLGKKELLNNQRKP
jgi:hypothetical protein